MISLDAFNIGFDILSLLVLLTLFLSLWTDKTRLPLHVNYRWATALSILYCAVDILREYFNHNAEYGTVVWYLTYFEFVLTYVITVFFSLYLFRLASLEERVCRIATVVYSVAAAVFSAYLFVLALLGYCFTVENGIYQQTALWSYASLFPFLCLLSNCFVLVISEAAQSVRITLAVLCMIPPIGLLISYKYFYISTISVLLLLISLILYVNIYVRQARELSVKDAELKSAQTEVLVSQIQPHFLYNCISTCVALCRVAPNSAAEMMTNLGKYLRVNIDAIRKKEPVSFEEELEHIKVYLSLEKYRLDEKLTVKYDIGESDFLLPALSIQPIVENAVKHGLAEPGLKGTITISSWEEDDCSIVEVKDDGRGFDPNAPLSTDRSHVGLENVRKRLELLVNGKMEIASEPGKGTVVTIRIPRE